jgi:hypothetical protein
MMRRPTLATATFAMRRRPAPSPRKHGPNARQALTLGPRLSSGQIALMRPLSLRARKETDEG